MHAACLRRQNEGVLARRELPEVPGGAGSLPFGDAGGQGEIERFRARARRLGLPFVAHPELGADDNVTLDSIHAARVGMQRDGERLAFIAPDEAHVPGLLHWLAIHPEARQRLRVTARTTLRMGLVQAARRALAAEAVDRLARRMPEFSARRVAAPVQVLLLLAGVLGLAACVAYLPGALLVGVNFVAAAFFFGITALRILAAAHVGTMPFREPDEMLPLPPVVPVYTVLVPLYREANMVPDLVAALDGLDWPRDRLDIKLLLEADDVATIAAARAATRGAPYEVVVVPPVGPRTKPKALSFALPFARGEFVTVYDAEDRPHPLQLREAYNAFRQAGSNVACFQAPLQIHNSYTNWLTLSFAVEYAALFDGLLPLLARLGLPMPLGGTSNHFRREVLEAVGGWDPYNVTEDADLGLRIARFGYRCGTLELPTLEEAPTGLWAWTKQRTRWFKGWMQTWLVHMRQPARLARELGVSGIIGFLLIGTGLVVSSVVYPIYVVTLVVMATDPLALWGDGGLFASMVVGVNLFNLAAGYLAMAVLATRALRLRGRMDEAPGVLFMPVYWFLMSIASYRALMQLILRPHHWEKTSHGTAATRRAAARDWRRSTGRR